MRTISIFGFFIFAILFSGPDFEHFSFAKGDQILNENNNVQYDPESGLDPAEEELDQVSRPIGEISEPVEATPTESLNEDSESIDQLGENLDEVSEPIGEASENLPIAPEGDGSDREYDTDDANMPLGDREAEGRGIGDY